ncbi:hypothetical protein [Paucisalibacillus globulus]|nr:hypothetical protein [Paucisalibacillus globulus]
MKHRFLLVLITVNLFLFATINNTTTEVSGEDDIWPTGTEEVSESQI